MSKGKKATIIQQNLKHLREKRKLSIQEMASLLGVVNRGTYYAWERGDSQPNISMLLKIAHEFDISVDELLKVDFGKKPVHADSDNAQDIYEVELVPYKAAAGYSAAYADPEWIEGNLQMIRIPFKPPIGVVRAFPVEGDSMEPKVSDGAYIVGVKLQDPKSEVVPGKDYVVVTRDMGILYKVFFWNNNKAQLISLNHSKHKPIEIEGNDIGEVWKCFCALDIRKND